MKRCSLCCSSFQRLPFGRRSAAGGINLNKGLLSDRERGDQFTDPTVYRNKKSIVAMDKVSRKTERLLKEEKQKEGMNALGVDSQMERELSDGSMHPLHREEIAAARVIDEDGLLSSDPGSKYTTALRRLMEREVDRRDHMMDKFGQPPTARSFIVCSHDCDMQMMSRRPLNDTRRVLWRNTAYTFYASRRVYAGR
ncbi:hypothetical protein C3747_411g1 [Trypanosoma cruzi]|uniref:Uncharacterized protein n=1 Tax=Trypanosoma cruzi TaxID=5693 RepID=A0A2V2V1T4_TRYCR|nr:hypothetical protein C3747_411g1 [Trypanosoma cruzi]